RRAHNPEVAGSNPAPAIAKGPGNRGLLVLGLVRWTTMIGSVGVPSAGDGVVKLDGEFQSTDSREVDPYPRITLDHLRKRVAAVWAAENDAGAAVDLNGPNRPGCTTAATGAN